MTRTLLALSLATSLGILVTLPACSGADDEGADAGTTPDAGTKTDAGSKPDAGSTPDAGTKPDAGSTPDAGNTDPSGVGGPCEDDTACGDGYCIPESLEGEETGFVGGYCSRECDPSNANSCPAGSTCYDYGDDYAECLKSCTSDDDCRDGYECDADDTCYPL